MKLHRCFITLFAIVLGGHIFSQQLCEPDAKLLTKLFLESEAKFKGYSVLEEKPLVFNNDTLWFLTNLAPNGYVLVGAKKYLPAIKAFSTESNFGPLSVDNPLYRLLVTDALLQIEASNICPKHGDQRMPFGLTVSAIPLRAKGEPEQWPEGQEGWIVSSWNQAAPYWNMCPIDPVSHSRSYTGCPATAMAMIMNFHATTNNIQFTDDDDYYHSYAGRNYYIDNDWQTVGFPSFDQLNKYLDTLSVHYENNDIITDNDKAALSFACGVAMRQVYTSQGSGTFWVSQAYNGYLRFACNQATLMYPDEPGIYDSIIQNIKQGYPVHLAVVDETNTSGHNLVIDGYRSDGYFHLDYGYGEYYNGWYLMPAEMQMGLTVIEGVIVNILKPENVNIPTKTLNREWMLYPVPAHSVLNIQCSSNISENVCVNIVSLSGELIYSEQVDLSHTENKIDINTENWPSGLYIHNQRNQRTH